MKFTPSLFASLALVALTVRTSAAEQITSTCRITAVDAAKRTITLVRKTPTGEKIGVAKLADHVDLQVGGKAVTLEALKVPLDASIVYDTELGVVVGIKMAGVPSAADGGLPRAVAPFDTKKAKEYQEAWAKHLGVPVETTNSIGMKLVLLPPGEFDMGSTDEEIAAETKRAKKDREPPWYSSGISLEGPRHRVAIERAFCLGAYEVTQGEYGQVVGANPSESKVDLRQPVENVTWFDAVTFCNRLSEREKIQPYYKIDRQTVSVVGGRGYRLPGEAEWEYACRAGTTTKWNFGNDEFAMGDHAWHGGNSGRQTHKVGEKKPNPWGLYDMHGNVSEWCWDLLREYGSKSANRTIEPSEGENRIFRGGGAFLILPGFLRSANRAVNDPGFRNQTVGFRVAFEVRTKD